FAGRAWPQFYTGRSDDTKGIFERVEPGPSLVDGRRGRSSRTSQGWRESICSGSATQSDSRERPLQDRLRPVRGGQFHPAPVPVYIGKAASWGPTRPNGTERNYPIACRA